MKEDETGTSAKSRTATPSENGADRLKDHELASLMLEALRHARPDALFLGGYEEEFDEMLVLIDGNFEMIKAARFFRDALGKADRSRP